MAGDDDDEVIVCSAAMLFCASAYLFQFSKRQHAVWVKRYLQERQQYGVYNTLLADLAASDDQRWMHYLRMDIGTDGTFVDALMVASHRHTSLCIQFIKLSAVNSDAISIFVMNHYGMSLISSLITS